MRAWLAGALIAASVAATAAGPLPVTIPSRDRDPATGALLQLGALLFLPPAAPGVRVPAVVALHGCRAALGTRGGYVPAAPLLLLVGSGDDWTAPEPCVDLVTRLRDAGAPATLALYADAAHGFDGPDGDRRHLDVPGGVHPGQGVTVASHPAARDDSYARVRAFLRAELRAGAGARNQEE